MLLKILSMFDSKNLTYILTMLEAIEKIKLYTKEFNNEESFYFANKQLNFNAVVNLLIVCGEENKKIDKRLKTSKEINWQNVSVMRDKISHDYRGIDESIVWDIVQNYLPKLKKALIEMIPKVENYQLYINEALKSNYYQEIEYLKTIFKTDKDK